jgi:hypothetical protein
MRFEFSLIAALTICFTLIPHAFAASDVRPCNLPQDLELVIGRTYRGATVVTSSDLNDDDRKFFEADHHEACPGLIKIDFYGDGQPTLAIVLLIPGGRGKKEQSELIVAHRVRNGWNLTDLGGGGPKPLVPVVWS